MTEPRRPSLMSMSGMGGSLSRLGLFGSRRAKDQSQSSSRPTQSSSRRVGPVQDLSRLQQIDDQVVTEVLMQRFAEKKMYTRLGDSILLTLTIHQPSESNYAEDIKQKYRDSQSSDIAPHLYALAEEAYRRTREKPVVVPLLMLGETGSGKTESAKEVMRYLLWRANALPTDTERGTPLGRAINASFVVLEAFGNARTLSGHNSSRFGLLRRLVVTPTGQLSGASYRIFGFDRWRVAGPAVGEYNFNVFYTLVEGAPEQVRESIGLPELRGSRQFKALRVGQARAGKSTPLMPGVSKRDEAASFAALFEAMEVMGVPNASRISMLRFLVALAHLGNVDAARMSIHGAAVPVSAPGAAGPSAMASDAAAGAMAAAGTAPRRRSVTLTATANDQLVRRVAQMFELDPDSPAGNLRAALLGRSVMLRGESVSIPHSAEQAEWCKRQLMCALYELVFRWLVGNANAEWAATDLSVDGPIKRTFGPRNPAKGSFIDVYDMPGFEALAYPGTHNGLEQLCANTLAELMQAHFVRDTFVERKAVYTAENLPPLPEEASATPNHDAGRLSAMLRGSPDGVFALLNESTASFGGDAEVAAANFASAVNDHHSGGFAIRLPARESDVEVLFTVRHYAKEVAYFARAFCARNNAALPAHIAKVLSRSSAPLMRELLQLDPGVVQWEPSGGRDGAAVGFGFGSDGGAGAMRAADLATTTRRGFIADKAHAPPLGYIGYSDRFERELRALEKQLALAAPTTTLFVVCIKSAPLIHVAQGADRTTVLRGVRARGLGLATKLVAHSWSRSIEYSWLHLRLSAELRKQRGLDWRTASTLRTFNTKDFALLLVRAYEVPEHQHALGKTKLWLRGPRGNLFYALVSSELVECLPPLKTALLEFSKRRQSLELLGPWLLAYRERVRFQQVKRAAIQIQAHARAARARKQHQLQLEERERGKPVHRLGVVAKRFGLHSHRTMTKLFGIEHSREDAAVERRAKRLRSQIDRRSSTLVTTAVGSAFSKLEKAAMMNEVERRWQSLVEQTLARARAEEREYQMLNTYLSRSRSMARDTFGGGGADEEAGRASLAGRYKGLRRRGSSTLYRPEAAEEAQQRKQLGVLIGGKTIVALETELTMHNTSSTRRKQIAAELESTAFRTGLREIVRYIIFLALFLAQLFQYSLREGNDVQRLLRRALHAREPDAFRMLASIEQTWEWLEGTFPERVFRPPGSNTDSIGRVLRMHSLIGAVRVQQERGVVSKECVPPMYNDAMVGVCYPGFTGLTYFDHVSNPRSTLVDDPSRWERSLEPFGYGMGFTPTEVEEDRMLRRVRRTYFIRDLPSDLTSEQALDALIRLKRGNWIDVQTRRVDILFTLYTPSVRVFTAVDLQLRFPETGGVQAYSYYKQFLIDRHWLVFDRENTLLFPAEPADWAMLGAEIMFYYLVAMQLYRELRALRMLGAEEYFSNAWAAIELVNMALFAVTCALRVRQIEMMRAKDWAADVDEFVDLLSIGEIRYFVQWLTAMNALLSFMKIFKYLTISPNLSMLNSTLSHAAEELVTFIILFIFVFLAFMQAFTIAFSTQLASCQDLIASFNTLWLIVIGVFDFVAFQEASPEFGPYLFFMFVIIIFFIFINVFIAIVTESFKFIKESRKNSDLGADPLAIAIRNGLARRFKALRGLAYGESAVEIAQERAEKEDKIDTMGGRSYVTREGLSKVIASEGGDKLTGLLGIEGEDDVDAIMRMFDKDNDGELDAEESQMLLEMIQKRATQAEQRTRREDEEAAAVVWPEVKPPPPPDVMYAQIVGHFNKWGTRPKYVPGEITLEDRVSTLATQSSALATAIARHNTDTVTAIDDLDNMLNFLASHFESQNVSSNIVAAISSVDVTRPFSLSGSESAGDPTLPMLLDRTARQRRITGPGGRRLSL